MNKLTNLTAKKINSWQIYKRLLSYTKPVWFGLVLSIFGYLFYAAANTALVELMKELINFAADKRSDMALNIAAFAIIITFSRGVGTFFGKYYIGYVSRFVVHKLRCDIFNKFLSLPKSFYDQNKSGTLIAKLTFDVELVTNACADALTTSMREGLLIIGLLAYLLYTNWSLTLIFLVATPLIAIVVVGVSKRFRKLTHRIQKSIGNVTHIATEAISGFNIVKIFAGSKYEQKRFQEVSKYNYNQSLKMIAAEAVSVPVIQLIVALALAILMYLALHPSQLAQMDVGQFTAFVTAAGLLAKPIRQISEVNVHIQKGIAAATKLFAQLDQENEPDTGKRELNKADGEIKFQNVNFSYDNKIALRNINLHIHPGSSVAIVGASGSGKTTLINLLTRFYNPNSGAIHIDGVDIQEYTLASLRQQIAVVEQQVTLFHDTIANNIAYGSLNEAEEEQIINAAKNAYALDFIQQLPDGFNTHIGEDGAMLSGGQRQRISLARAFLKDAPILILDEATAALDNTSEKYIQQALSTLSKQRTTLIIAHRLSTIEQADIIVVMKQGQIVETGTHTELLNMSGEYASLVQTEIKPGT